MKIRIIGILIVLAVLGTLVFLTENDNQPRPAATPSFSNDNSFKDLKIN